MSVPRIRGERVQRLAPASHPSRRGPSPGPPAPLNDTPLPEDARLILGALVVFVSLSLVVKDTVLAVIVAVGGWYVVTKLRRLEAKKAQVSHCLESARADIIPALREFEGWARRVLACWQGRELLDGVRAGSSGPAIARALESQPEGWLHALGDHAWLLPHLEAYSAGLRWRAKVVTEGIGAWLGQRDGKQQTDSDETARQVESLLAAVRDIRNHVLDRYVEDLGREPQLNADAHERLAALAEDGKALRAPPSTPS